MVLIMKSLQIKTSDGELEESEEMPNEDEEEPLRLLDSNWLLLEYLSFESLYYETDILINKGLIGGWSETLIYLCLDGSLTLDDPPELPNLIHLSLRPSTLSVAIWAHYSSSS